MEIDAQIANRLKSLRAHRGWSLEQLAAASGVSRAMISKIEREEASATAALLSRLCVALEIPVSDLLAPAATASLLTRRAQRSSWRDPATGFVRQVVSPRSGHSTVEVIEVELPPLAQVAYEVDPAAHYSQHILALTGGLRVAQDSLVDLEAGDALFMTPAGPIRFQNTTDRPCRYLVVVEHRSHHR